MSILARIREGCMETLFPSDGRCALCNRLLLLERAPFCYSCVETIPYIREEGCSKCGKAVKNQERCHDCSYSHHDYQQGRALFSYNKIGRRIIQDIKFEGNKKLALWVGQRMGENLQQVSWIHKIHMVIPVPLHKHRLKERGFNQSLLIAQGMEEVLGLSLEEELLHRIKDTPHQTDLTKQERQRNISGAFQVTTPSQVQGKNILLIDDVYTTGSTINACARTLLAAGAGEIYFAVAAIGQDSTLDFR